MKDLLKYSKLWQKKRDELNVNANPDTDWLDMQQALNKHLPQNIGGSSSGSGSRPNFFKAGPIAGFSAVAIVATYLIVHLAGSKVNKHQRPDSIAGNRDTMQVANPNSQTLPAATDSLKGDSLKSADKNNLSRRDSADRVSSVINQLNGKTSINSNPASGVNKTMSGVNPNRMFKNSRANNGVNQQVSRGALYIANNNGSKPNGKPGETGTHNNGTQQPGGANNPIQIDSIKNILPAGSVGDTTQNKPDNPLNKPMGQADINHTETQTGVSNNADVKTKDNQLTNPGSGTSLGDSVNRSSVKPGRRRPVPNANTNAPKDNKKDKRKKMTNSNDSSSVRSSRLDWGILAGVNTSGSFTAKSQNSNIYGSFPIDAYLGLFGTYHVSEKWAIGLQVQALNPQKISGGYNHANGSKVDSGKIIQVTDERKAWFVSLPIHVAYKLTDNLSLKAGPVINIPVKQISISNSLTPTTIKKDTVYYKKVTGQINAARYDQKINFGLSGGLGLEFGRFNIDATYFKNLSGYNVTSDFGTYKINPGSLQFSVGFKFNKPKQ